MRFLAAFVAAAIVAVSTLTASTANGATSTGDGVSAYKLAAHNAAVKYDKPARMWDCKEHCSGCETARWTLPVLPPGAAAGRA